MIEKDMNIGYPKDFWEVKCKDNLIRDTMYSQELWKDPYYGLQKVDINRDRIPSFTVLKGMVIAGGYAMYLAGWTDTYSDIDMFVMDKKKAEEWISSQRGVFRTTNCVSSYIHISGAKYAIAQVILRLYKAPTEIVHGFDLDCVGILWDGQDLWATERALYAHEHKANWFDPARASPSYAYRLSKYSLRGYTIMLPGFDEAIIDHNKFKALYDQVLDLYLCMIAGIDDNGEVLGFDGDPLLYIELTRRLITNAKLRDRDLSNMDIARIITQAIMQHAHLGHYPGDPNVEVYSEPLKLGMMVRALNGYIYNSHVKGEKIELYTLLPKDPVSILILAKFYRFHTGLWKQRDYDRRMGTDQEYIRSKDALKMIHWIEQDPMAQVSSTFYPTPIQDLQSWYRTSPLVHGYIPPPPEEKVSIHFHAYDKDEE